MLPLLMRFYNEIFQKRHKGDYEERPVFDPEDVAQLLSITKEFVSEIEILIRQ